MSLHTPSRLMADPGALTPAEVDFLRELAAGARGLQEVAARLGMTPRSAQRRSSVICQKLGAANWRDALAEWRGRAA